VEAHVGVFRYIRTASISTMCVLTVCSLSDADENPDKALPDAVHSDIRILWKLCRRILFST
jgi:hypothetical protein